MLGELQDHHSRLNNTSITIDGAHEVNEVFFDDVKVQIENLVGEEDKGWDYAKFLLANERTGIARIGVSKERIARVKRLAKETPAGGRTLWDELVMHYSQGVEAVQRMRRTWAQLSGLIDEERYAQVGRFLAIQEHEARWWRDAAISYFQSFSHLPLPAGAAPPAHSLDYYEHVRCPANRDKPRCDQIP